MKRDPKRSVRRFARLTWIAVAMLVLSISVWTLCHTNVVYRQNVGSRALLFTGYDGHLQFLWRTTHWDASKFPELGLRFRAQKDSGFWRQWPYPMYRGGGIGGGASYWTLFLPMWMPTLAVVMVGVALFLKWKRARRRVQLANSMCANCGYALARLTKPRCPECGLPFVLLREEDST